MSKLIDYIVDEARESTENEEFDETVGLSEEEIIKFINQAQSRLHSKIVAQHPLVFTETETKNVVANQEAYTINHKSYLANKISQVEYSSTSSTDDLYVLRKGYLRNRDTGADGDPDSYIRRGGQILLLPTPTDSNGLLRITYIRKIKKLDKRRGQVKAVTLDSGTSTITNLEINYVNGSTVDNTALLKDTRFTVVDKYGNIKMENVLLSSLTTSASYDATLSVDSSFTYQSGETIAVDDYVVPGPYTTTHFELGDEVERYVQVYTEFKILKRDSSVDSQEAFQELAEIEQDIIDSYADISDDILEIPQINEDDWW
jgi:hypothetical protein